MSNNMDKSAFADAGAPGVRARKHRPGAPAMVAASEAASETGRPGGFWWSTALTWILGLFRPSREAPFAASASRKVDDGAGMVGKIINLTQIRLDDVAVPRAAIVAVPLDIGLDRLVQKFRESGLTRLPVYDGTLDCPVGMAHLKDLALRAGFTSGGAADFDLKALLRPLIYAPPSMPVGVLLQKMQTQRTHMALVIDEYGGVDGLVTIEDMIEQVIGEIEDEHDQEEGPLWRQEKPGCYLARAQAPLGEFQAETGLCLTDPLEDEDIDTLGGVVFVLAGRVPAMGEVVRHPLGIEFEVVEADPRRIKRLRVRVPAAAASAG